MEVDESRYQSLRPVRVTWSHGDILPGKASHLACEMLSDIRNTNKVKKVVVADDNQNVYCGKLDQSALSSNYIAVRNRKTNNVRWYPVDNFFMFPYRPDAESKSQVKEEGNISRKDAMFKLNKAMGSKKTKRRLMEVEKVNVSVSDIEKKLKTAIEENNLVVDTHLTISPTQSEINYMPPCNRNADSVEAVYKVYDLLSAEILDSLDGIASDVMKSDILHLAQDTRLSEFFFKVLARISKQDSIKIKLLLFADSLVKFLKEPMKTVRSKNTPLCQFSEGLNKKLSEEFCTIGLNNLRNRPPSMRDKAICYILVCLLLISDFKLNINVLSGFISPKDYQRLPTFMRAIGATKDKNSQTEFCLKLPLAEMPLSTGSRRKSGGFGKQS